MFSNVFCEDSKIEKMFFKAPSLLPKERSRPRNNPSGSSMLSLPKSPTSVNARDEELISSLKLQSETLSEKARQKPIIYPEFQEAAEYAKDNYWRDLLLLASRGEFNGRRITYDGQYLSLKEHGVRERIARDNPERVCNQMTRLYRTHLGFVSPDELAQEQTNHQEAMSKIIILTWKGCSKRMRSYLLFNYASSAVEDYEADEDSLTQLISLLLSALECKCLNDKNVEMRCNFITSILPLRYNVDRNWWWLDYEYCAKPAAKTKKTKAVGTTAPKKGKKNKNVSVDSTLTGVLGYYQQEEPKKKRTAKAK